MLCILLCLGNMLVFLICILVYLNLFDDEKKWYWGICKKIRWKYIWIIKCLVFCNLIYKSVR